MRNLSLLLITAILLFACTHKNKSSLDLLSFDDSPGGIDTTGANRIFSDTPLETEIAMYGRVDGSAIGIGGIKSEQYKRYEKLKLYSDEKLIELISFKSSVLKAYAFDALTERYSKYALTIFKSHIHDTTTINVMSGCIGSNVPLNEYFYHSVEKMLSKEDKNKYSYISKEDIF